MAAIETALGDAASVVNVGAGTGSYEPQNRNVLGIEPSDVMRAQRPQNTAPCVKASAEALPLGKASYDAAMAILSVHHWPDSAQGLREMRRVARKRIVLVTFVPDAEPFWLTKNYFPEILEEDRRRFPASDALMTFIHAVIGPAKIDTIPIPYDCTDGFLCAYWRRPEAYLSAEVRSAISSFAGLKADEGLMALKSDIESGLWAKENADILNRNEMDFGYRLVRCELTAAPTL